MNIRALKFIAYLMQLGEKQNRKLQLCSLHVIIEPLLELALFDPGVPAYPYVGAGHPAHFF
jgi:hypothetical protein